MASTVLEEPVSQHRRAEHQPGQHPGRTLFDDPVIKRHIVPLKVDQYHVLIEQGAIAEKAELRQQIS